MIEVLHRFKLSLLNDLTGDRKWSGPVTVQLLPHGPSVRHIGCFTLNTRAKWAAAVE